MPLTVAAPTAGTLQLLGAVVIGTLDASGTFVQYATVSYKNPVRVATTANGTLATAFANGQTVDGIVLATGDRILLKNQSAPADNGIYVVAATGAPSRASDMDTWSEVPGSVVGVLVGTTNADTAWLCTSDSGGTLGVTAINFSQFGAGIATPVSIANGGTGQITDAAALAALGGLAAGGIGTTFSSFQTSAETVTNSDTLTDSTQCVLALAPGTYDCESWEMTGNADITAYSKSVLAFSGTASQTGIALILRAFSTNEQAANDSTVIALNTGGGIAFNTVQVNFGANVALVMRRYFRIVVTVAGNLTIQFAEVNATALTSAILYAGSYLRATRKS